MSEPRANCRDVPPERMFPSSNSGPKRIKAATDVCTGCLLSDPCLAYALAHKVDGVWAGTTERDRSEMRRKHGIKAQPLSFGGLVKRGNAPGAHPGGTAVGVETHRKRYEPLCEACEAFDRERAS